MVSVEHRPDYLILRPEKVKDIGEAMATIPHGLFYVNILENPKITDCLENDSIITDDPYNGRSPGFFGSRFLSSDEKWIFLEFEPHSRDLGFPGVDYYDRGKALVSAYAYLRKKGFSIAAAIDLDSYVLGYLEKKRP